MNIRGAAGGDGNNVRSSTDVSDSIALVNAGRKILAMDELWPAAYRGRAGPSPVEHNGRYWTPNRHRENADTVRYIRCLVKTCEAIKPRVETRNVGRSSLSRTKITLDQLPRIMQKVCARQLIHYKIQIIFYYFAFHKTHPPRDHGFFNHIRCSKQENNVIPLYLTKYCIYCEL